MAICRVTIEHTFSGGGGPGVNVWHVNAGALVGSNLELQDMVDAIRLFYFSIASCFASTSTFRLGSIVDVDSQEIRTASFSPVQGTGGTSMAPHALQIVVGWRTSLAARRGRGRTFLGPLSGTTVTGDGTPDDAKLTLIRNAAATLIADSEGIDNGSIVVYGLEDAAPTGTEDYSDLPRIGRDIKSATVRDVFAVLRSRRD